MQKSYRWIHVALETVGALTVIAVLGWLFLWVFFLKPMSHFTDGNCTDTDEHVVASPDGKRTAKFFHSNCGPYTFESVYLSTGNPNPGYEYVQIFELKNVAIGETSVTWRGPEEVAIDFPATAELGDAYAKVLGVQVTLHPH
jgi:hypothetical protein